MTHDDIDWPVIKWTQAPRTSNACDGAVRYQYPTRSIRKQCLATPVRATKEGDFCLSCWRLLPVCDLCQETKGTIKYHVLNMCNACYLPDFSDEYLALSAHATMSGESLGQQLEAIRPGRFEVSGERNRKKMVARMKAIGVPPPDYDLRGAWGSGLTLAERQEKHQREVDRLEELRGDK